MLPMQTLQPLRTATTGTPLAMASNTTKPSVSVSEGITNMSPLAYASLSSWPRIMP